MSDGQPQVFIVGKAPNQRRIAFRRRAPVRNSGPGVVWLSGYRSDMDFDKGDRARQRSRAARSRLPAIRLFGPWALRRAARGRRDLLLARGGAGAHPGRERGTADSDRLFDGRMAGAARRAGAERGRRNGARQGPHSHRACGRLHRSPRSGPRRRRRRGVRSWRKAYGEGPPPIRASPTASPARLIEDGRKHLMLGGMIRIRAPIMVLQGMRDEDVPFSHALALMQRLRRSGDADARQGWRSPAVPAARLAADVRRAGKDGRLGARTRVAATRILSPTSPRTDADSRRGP